MTKTNENISFRINWEKPESKRLKHHGLAVCSLIADYWYGTLSRLLGLRARVIQRSTLHQTLKTQISRQIWGARSVGRSVAGTRKIMNYVIIFVKFSVIISLKWRLKQDQDQQRVHHFYLQHANIPVLTNCFLFMLSLKNLETNSPHIGFERVLLFSLSLHVSGAATIAASAIAGKWCPLPQNPPISLQLDNRCGCLLRSRGAERSAFFPLRGSCPRTLPRLQPVSLHHFFRFLEYAQRNTLMYWNLVVLFTLHTSRVNLESGRPLPRVRSVQTYG